MSADESEPFTKRESDTLASSVVSSKLGIPEVEAPPQPTALELKLEKIEQRLAACELRITGFYDRLASLEREKKAVDDRSVRSVKILLLWVGLIFLFVVIWNFLGPGSLR
jgi:hypothetical protein